MVCALERDMPGSDDNDLDGAIGPSALDRVGAIAASELSPAVAAVTEATADAALAEAIASGTLAPEAARAILVEQVVREQMPTADEHAITEACDRLVSALDGDPTLANLLRQH